MFVFIHLARDQAPQWGKKGKKRDQIEKYRRAVSWGGGKGGEGSPPSPPAPRLPLGSLRLPIFSPFSHNEEPGSRLLLV